MEGFNEKASHVDDEICMSHPELSFPDLRSLKMYRSIWKPLFFVLFFKPCLSTCFCLFKYSYRFYLILSHLTYKRKQMHMQTEIIITLMYSLISRETLLCWLWMPWLRHGALQNWHHKCASGLFHCVRICVCVRVCVNMCVCVCALNEGKRENSSNAAWYSWSFCHCCQGEIAQMFAWSPIFSNSPKTCTLDWSDTKFVLEWLVACPPVSPSDPWD